MKRYIRSAEQPSVEEKLKDQIDQLNDDFDYAIAGIEKLAADGNFGAASELARSLSEMVNASIEEVSENISSEAAPAAEE